MMQNHTSLASYLLLIPYSLSTFFEFLLTHKIIFPLKVFMLLPLLGTLIRLPPHPSGVRASAFPDPKSSCYPVTG